MKVAGPARMPQLFSLIACGAPWVRRSSSDSDSPGGRRHQRWGRRLALSRAPSRCGRCRRMCFPDWRRRGPAVCWCFRPTFLPSCVQVFSALTGGGNAAFSSGRHPPFPSLDSLLRSLPLFNTLTLLSQSSVSLPTPSHYLFSPRPLISAVASSGLPRPRNVVPKDVQPWRF